MFIKKLKPGIFDVFVDNGWNNWTRVRRMGDKLVYVCGNYLPRHLFNQVKEKLIK